MQQTLGSLAQTVHRPKDKITEPSSDQAQGISSLKDQSADQEDQEEPEKQDITKGRTSLAGQASLARLGLPRKQAFKIIPASLPVLPEANCSTALPHSDKSHRSVQCQAPK